MIKRKLADGCDDPEFVNYDRNRLNDWRPPVKLYSSYSATHFYHTNGVNTEQTILLLRHMGISDREAATHGIILLRTIEKYLGSMQINVTFPIDDIRRYFEIEDLYYNR